MRIAMVFALVVIHETTLAVPAELESREGYVMPTACKSREAEGGPEVHTTECALELECVVTGYGLWVDGEFFEFDDDGDQIALKYFRETTKKDHHLVSVTGEFGDVEVDVETLEPISP
ncbi:MAG TPA: hypothetical protein VEK15_27525 [Vicinamibacteria bacterium]|nr:hypothetical protein [Vicinamibacteria bacterium]